MIGPVEFLAIMGSAGAASVAITKGVRWVQNRGKRDQMTTEKKTKLNVALTVPEYNLINVWADKSGMTLSDYVRKTLIASVPVVEQERASHKGEKDDILDEAYAHLDRSDAYDTGTSQGSFPILPPQQARAFLEAAAPLANEHKRRPLDIPAGPPTPHRVQQPGVITEATRTHPLQRTSDKPHGTTLTNVPPGPHPCMHLLKVAPRNMTGQCQGTCRHRDQDGRACFWTPTAAMQCPKFEAVIQQRRVGPHGR